VRVLITGCSRGIGRAAAELLTGAGHEVVATSQRVSDLDGVQAALRLPLDVTDTESVNSAVAAAGPLDAVVNNAGVGVRGPVETITPAVLRRAYEVNVLGTLRVCQAVLPQMRARRHGRIVAMSSVAGRRSMPLVGHYAATKHAVEAMCEALRYEVAPWDIKVSLIEPAGVRTEFSQHRVNSDAAPEVIDAYDAVVSAVERNARAASDGAVTAEVIAAAVRDVLEMVDPPLRLAPTEQARSMIEQRRMTADADYERQLLDAIGLHPGSAHQEA
jgi:NADP-dependent 3-hydroxy acid dehydrogenase YdfG